MLVCVRVRARLVHSHIEEIQSDAVEALAVCVRGDGGRVAGGGVPAVVPRQGEHQGLEGLRSGAPGDRLGCAALVMLVLGVGLG